MLSKSRIKYVNRFHHKKFRKELGIFIAEGPKVVEELLHSLIKIEELFAVKEWAERNAALLKSKKIKVSVIKPAELKAVSGLQTPNEVLAVCVTPPGYTAEININPWLFLYLDGISDPGNLGTIIRLADWFGLKQLFLSETSAEVFSPKVVQSTMGSLARVKTFYLPLETLIRITGRPAVIGADMRGENVFVSGIPKRSILVIGSESHGIAEKNLKLISKRVCVPSAKGSETESLNAAVASSIIISEAFRKNNFSAR